MNRISLFRNILLAGLIVARTSHAAMAAEARFLIVGPEQFHEALKPYALHKQSQLSMEIVLLERVLAKTAGVDDPEKLKRYLFDRWSNGGVDYVLLVGDADVMPIRYMVLDRKTPAAFDYAFYPTDLYYADLANQLGEFDDWNASRDGFHAGYFGEVRGEANKEDPINFDAVDYRPDVALGRWPVSTVEQVEIVVAKSIRYETAITEKKKPGLGRAAFVSVDGWVDTRARMDRMGERIAERFEISKRYYADQNRDDGTEPPNQKQVVGLLNDGVGLMFHAGHGTDDQWEKCFSVRALRGVNNADRLPIMISAGCSTARIATLPPYEAYRDVHGTDHKGTDAGEKFTSPPPPPAPYQTGKHNPSGLGEQLLRGGPHGAVAYIGCNTGSQPCGLTLLDGFTLAMQNSPEARLGDCWKGALIHYYEAERLATLRPTRSWYPPSIFFQGMKFMFFGDPTLLLPF